MDDDSDTPRPRLRLKARWRLIRGSLRVVVWVAFGLALLAGFLLKTGLGHRTVLGWGVGQLRARVAGSVEVAEIRSANLLRGGRLIGVRLATPEGGTFVEADSLEVSYSLGGLLRGALAFEAVRLWNPRLVLDRDSAGTGSLARWLRGGRAADPGGGGGFAIRIDGLEIIDGSLALRMPADLDPEGLFRVEIGPDGGTQRAIDLRGLQAQVGRLELSPDVGTVVSIERATAEVDVLKRRFLLEGLRGDVTVLDRVLETQLRTFAAPGIEGSGRIGADWAGDEGLVVEIEAALDEADLEEWDWVTDLVPPVRGALALQGRLAGGEQRWTGTDIDVAWAGGGRVRGEGTIVRGSTVSFEGVDLAVDQLPLTALDPYLAEPLQVAGEVSGRIALSGRPTDLDVDGQMTLAVPAAPRLGVVFDGAIVRSGEALGVDDFHVTLDPLDYGVLGRFFPQFRLTGTGRAVLAGSGSLAQGLGFTANLSHAAPGVGDSHVLLSGNLLETLDDRIRVDIQGDFSPLSLDALARDFGDLPIGGSLTGPIRARGVLRDLEVTAQLETPEGDVDLAGRINARDPGSRYQLQATVLDFLASDLVPSLPGPTIVSGRIDLDGSGLDPATLEATGSVEIDHAMVRGVRVDSLRAAAHVAQGLVTFDTLSAAIAGFAVSGEGTLASDSAGPTGILRLAFDAPDLTGIRAITRGDTVLTGDDLTALDRDVLVLRGVDPDTLPALDDVRADGRVYGEVVLEGAISRFSAVGWMEGEGLRYGRSSVEGGRVDFDVEGLPGLAGAAHAELRFDATRFAERDFSGGTVSLEYQRPQGLALIELARDSTEDYRMRARFELDSLGGAIDFEEFAVRIDSLSYRSTRPTRVVWTDSVLALDSLEIVGSGLDPVTIRAAGTLPRRGVADFDVDIQGLALSRLTRVAQREDLDLSGTVDFTGSVRGTAARPLVEGQIAVRQLEARNLVLERVEGTVAYDALEVTLGLDAWARDTRVLRVDGLWPVSLALDGSSADVSDRPVDLAVRLDSLPAGLVLSLMEDLEDTRGAFTGTLDVAGVPSALEPSGSIRLEGGAWTVGALGVRQEQVEATFDVQPDRRVQVAATGRSGGTVDVTGTLQLDSLANPALDLDITLASFNAVDRRDIAGAVSGDLELLGRYRQPRVIGTLQVERGDLFLDEFTRNVGVVDLSDPRFYTYINDDLISGQPLLAATQNPFMDNLLVAIDLGVQRNTWLRSTQLNVEMRGDLIVTYDRQRRDVVMIGELEAVRGQYQFLAQSFEVEGGTIEFIGIPGINPNMNIQAAARVRRQGGSEPLEINAQVGGTLIEPRVELTTEDAAVSESDILSYIAVGQPASALTSSAGSTVLGGVTSFVGGSLTSSLSSLAQGAGWLDYFAISQAVDATALGTSSQAIGRSFSGTQVEFGRYFGDGDYFGAVMFRPLYAAGGTGSLLGGARIEWQASDQYHVELFAEDRFFRNSSFGFRDFEGDFSLVFGFSLFREWGY